jgi:hypothetical protein
MTRRLTIYSAIGSELREISTTVSTRFKVFSEGAAVRVGDYGG